MPYLRTIDCKSVRPYRAAPRRGPRRSSWATPGGRRARTFWAPSPGRRPQRRWPPWRGGAAPAAAPAGCAAGRSRPPAPRRPPRRG